MKRFWLYSNASARYFAILPIGSPLIGTVHTPELNQHGWSGSFCKTSLDYYVKVLLERGYRQPVFEVDVSIVMFIAIIPFVDGIPQMFYIVRDFEAESTQQEE